MASEVNGKSQTPAPGPDDRYVTNRQLYDALTEIRGAQQRMWMAIFAIGSVNASALLKAFGGPDVPGLLVGLWPL